jgi:hypothetical protein
MTSGSRARTVAGSPTRPWSDPPLKRHAAAVCRGWQVLRDLTAAPRSRSRSSVRGLQLKAGARGCSRFREQTAGGAGRRVWNSTMHVPLLLLRDDLGLDPASDQVRRTVGLSRAGEGRGEGEAKDEGRGQRAEG